MARSPGYSSATWEEVEVEEGVCKSSSYTGRGPSGEAELGRENAPEAGSLQVSPACILGRLGHPGQRLAMEALDIQPVSYFGDASRLLVRGRRVLQVGYDLAV